ncbi:MAG: chromosome segregation protein SMC [Pseudomonadota bacterium]
MRITKIRVSGFKSFVDSTTLSLPGNLTCIVGPNGCGKSNIIDALQWVMGESSAKHLRGDSMADVIFTGSNTRKPVGQATVEIIFDNVDGKIGGQYASFGEISIRRTVSRDGISTYFLNGTRCRRKDITDAFLGTGIGSKGYSVIEQGMISRVIEAKPEELRGFLEEAAGISKYKERRRETENRIRRTNDNLARLDDLREELSKQLNHLQRQAKAAERFQQYKEEERLTEGKLLACRWQARAADQEQAAGESRERETALEAKTAEIRDVEAHQATIMEQQSAANQTLNERQNAFYAESAEISRLEQALRHSEDNEKRLTTELASAREAHQEAGRNLARDRTRLGEATSKLEALTPDANANRQNEEAASSALKQAETGVEDWQHVWDTLNERQLEISRQEQSAQVKLEHLDANITESRERIGTLESQRIDLRPSELDADIEQLRARLGELEKSQDEAIGERDTIALNLTAARARAREASDELHDLRSELEEQKGRLSSLRALQDTALGEAQRTRNLWLEDRGIDNQGVLAESIKVEAGWERAIEAALGEALNSFCGPGLVDDLSAQRGAVLQEGIAVVDTAGELGARESALMPGGARALGTLIKAPQGVGKLVAEVFACETLDEALALRPKLKDGQRVVTKDGSQLGRNWLSISPRDEQQLGVLAREKAIDDGQLALNRLEENVATVSATATREQEEVASLESRERQAADRLQEAAATIAADKALLARRETEADTMRSQSGAVNDEIARLARRAEESQQARNSTSLELDSVAGRLTVLESERNTHAEKRQALQAALDEARNRWRAARERAHEVELKLQDINASKALLEKDIERNDANQRAASTRIEEIETTITDTRAPRETMQIDLNGALDRRVKAEQALGAARSELDDIQQAQRQAAEQHLRLEQEMSERQSALEAARLDQRAIEVRLQELADRIEGSGFELKALREQLGEATEEALGNELERIAARIARLGPINLAAIEEFDQLSERKEYLDRQHEDLLKALATLDDAIKKIDRETRTRFQETFDKVNDGLKAMFPVLFGGGHAYLEMTGNDLLETGVAVMARPPGKRNSSIQLLSGGEKALTALAFVFSIFELNPAPYCLLDEVDAPLDDANVLRLAEMLKTMAESVQFVVVTHNKLTMEIASQLIGVTMQEPGVSRLVSVDMEQAVEMAAAS